MTVIQSRINTRSAEFESNRKHMQSLVDELTGLVDDIKQGGGEKY